MKLGIYLDYLQQSLLSQIEHAKRLNAQGKLIIRNINGDHFLNSRIETEVLPYLNRIDILSLDLSDKIKEVKNLSLYADKIKQILSLTQSQFIILSLDFNQNLNNLISLYDQICEQIPNVNFIVRAINKPRGVLIESFMKQIRANKRTMLLFDPSNIYTCNLSYLTEYRISKNFISGIVLNDISQNNNYTLIGYGSLNIIDFYKKLYTDKYKQYLFYDGQIEQTVDCFIPKYKFKGKFQKGRKNKKDYQFILERLKLDRKESDIMTKIIDNQFLIINKIFNFE